MPRRKSTGCVATMIFTPFGETPIIGALATAPPSLVPTRATEPITVMRAPAISISIRPAAKRATSDGELSGDVGSPTTVTGTNIACCAQALSDGQPGFATPDVQQAAIDAPAPGNGRDIHVRFRAFRKDPRLLFVGPIPPLGSTGNHLDPPVDSIMPGFIHDSKPSACIEAV